MGKAMKSTVNLDSKPDDYYTTIRTDMMGFIPPDARKILDVGCGEGRFGARLKASGAEVWGVELQSAAAATAQKILDRVLAGDIAEKIAELPDGYFDCIVFNDVLEHLVDPYSVLFRVKTKLARDGVVVCSIPNVRYFDNLKKLVVKKQWKYVDAGLLDKTHLRFFTKKSIEDMFDELDYDIVRLAGINPCSRWDQKVLNFLTMGHLSDTKYLQFACVAKPRIK